METTLNLLFIYLFIFLRRPPPLLLLSAQCKVASVFGGAHYYSPAHFSIYFFPAFSSEG